jgi:hypothetical protein
MVVCLHQRKSLLNTPVKISSFNPFQALEFQQQQLQQQLDLE